MWFDEYGNDGYLDRYINNMRKAASVKESGYNFLFYME
jgi:hypothetical protein